jgi:hypothetical protein
MINNTKQRMEMFADWARARIALIKEDEKDQIKEDVFSFHSANHSPRWNI